MKKYYQEVNYPYGDCVRTCIASILETDNLEDVPNFMRDGEDSYDQYLNDWLKENNTQMITIEWDGLKHFRTYLNCEMYVLLSGKRKGVYHSVVGRYSQKEAHNIQFEHDPLKGENYFFSDNEENLGIFQVLIFLGNDKFKYIQHKKGNK